MANRAIFSLSACLGAKCILERLTAAIFHDDFEEASFIITFNKEDIIPVLT